MNVFLSKNRRGNYNSRRHTNYTRAYNLQCAFGILSLVSKRTGCSRLCVSLCLNIRPDMSPLQWPRFSGSYDHVRSISLGPIRV